MTGQLSEEALLSLKPSNGKQDHIKDHVSESDPENIRRKFYSAVLASILFVPWEIFCDRYL